jgi:hypothetical protein
MHILVESSSGGTELPLVEISLSKLGGFVRWVFMKKVCELAQLSQAVEDDGARAACDPPCIGKRRYCGVPPPSAWADEGVAPWLLQDSLPQRAFGAGRVGSPCSWI